VEIAVSSGTETSRLPGEWEWRRIGEIGIPVRGGSPRPAGDPRYFDGSFIPWLTVAALTNIAPSQLVVSETATCLTEAGSALSRILDPGTLIIANSGATLGIAKILGIKCCANDGIAAVLSISRKVSPRYLAHFINTKTQYLREVVATGNGQPNLNTALIRSFEIPLPPTRTEQEGIADALSDADGLIESLERLIAKERQIKQGAMQELLTGKKRLPGFGGEWKSATLGELFTFSGGFAASRLQLSEKGHCYLHYGDIHLATKSFIDVQAEGHTIPRLSVSLGDVSVRSLLQDGDVVFVDASEDEEGASKYVVIGNPNGIPFISGLHTIVAKARTSEMDHRYLRYCFQTRTAKTQFRFFAVGTKVLGVSKSEITKIELSFPLKAEQAAIGAVLSDMDAEIDELEKKLDKARQIKQGMMQELLAGRIRLI
jgi:type I restriction enzyme S subunit